MRDEELLDKLTRQVDLNFEEQVDFLSELVTYESITGQEGKAQHFFARTCREWDLKPELLYPDPEVLRSHPSFLDAGLDYSERPNVIVRAGGDAPGRSLILNGHIDVVSPEPADQWTVDPWGGHIKDGLLYGRGASDMKGGLSANLFALKAVLDLNMRPGGSVTIESVIEEEAGGSGGTLACFVNGVTADGMIVTEPSLETLAVTHPGLLHCRVKVTGRTAHAGFSHEGVNAIVKMIPVVKALEELDRMRAETLSYPRVEELTGRSCNLCMGKLSAGDWVSTVAGQATLECRVGFVPGETVEMVKNQIEKTVRDSVKDDDWFLEHPVKVEWFNWETEPWVEPEDSPLTKSFLEAGKIVLGEFPRLIGTPFAMDTRFGPLFQTPSICFGPEGGNLHAADEYVELESVRRVTKVLALFIARWCGLEG